MNTNGKRQSRLSAKDKIIIGAAAKILNAVFPDLTEGEIMARLVHGGEKKKDGARYYSIGEAAKILHYNRVTVSKLISSGRVRAVRPFGRRVLIPASEIDNPCMGGK